MKAITEKQSIARIPDDEPIFILRGQDKLAAAVVRFWADRAEQAGVRSGKVMGARDCADAMDAWPVKKLPD